MSHPAATAEAAFTVAGPVGGLSGAVCAPETGESPDEAATVVFVHGVNMNRRVWGEMIPALGAMRRISFDLRGHGASIPAGPFTVDDYVGDLAAVVAAWGTRRVHLAGVSLGGMIVCRFAQLHPARVASVITFGSGLAVRHADLDGGMSRLAEVGPEAYFGTSLRVNSLPADVSPALAQTAWEMATEGRGQLTEMVIAITRAAFTTDLGGVLGPIAAPGVIVNGSDDRTCSPVAGAAMAEAIGAELIEIVGTGHVLPLERPELCAELVARTVQGAREPIG